MTRHGKPYALIQPISGHDLEGLGWKRLAEERLRQAWEGEDDPLYDYLSRIRLFTAFQETKFLSEPLILRPAQMAVVDAPFVIVALQNPDAAVRHMRAVAQALVDKKHQALRT